MVEYVNVHANLGLCFNDKWCRQSPLPEYVDMHTIPIFQYSAVETDHFHLIGRVAV